MAKKKPGNTKGTANGPAQPSGRSANEANPPVKPENTPEIDAVDALQMVLDLAGMIPGAGAIPDLINAAISLMRGDFAGALFSAGSAIPGIGDAAGAAKILKNSEKYAAALKTIETKVLPHLPAPMRKRLEEYLAKVRKKIDDLTKKDAPKPKETKKDGMKSEGKEDARCTLKTYKEGCKNGGTAHHVVPDHCFHKTKKQGGGNYPGTEKITHANGLCICVGGIDKNKDKDGGVVRKKKFKGKLAEYFGALAEHGKAHLLMDAQEAALGAANTPRGTATLAQLEDAGARSAALVTGCDPAKLKEQLRTHHAANGLPENTRLRADPFGQRPPAANTPGMGTSKAGQVD
jgi:hypothetical protein